MKLERADSLQTSLLALLSLSYGVLYWRYSNIFDVDHGRWMYEVWRFAEGGVPYRDLPWQYPPLSLYLYGWLASVFSPSITTLAAISLAVYGLICLLGFSWLRQTCPRSLAALACFTAFFMVAFRSVHIGGAPLPTGMYCPAQPVGGLLALALAHVFLRSQEKPTVRQGIAGGLLAAALMLTKQDFWGLASLLLAAGLFPLDSGKIRSRVGFAMAQGLTFALAFGAAVLLLWHSGGWSSVRVAFTGYSQGSVSQLLPNLNLVARNLFYAALLYLFIVGVLRASRALSRAGTVRALLLCFPVIALTFFAELWPPPEAYRSSLFGVMRWLIGESVEVFIPLVFFLLPLGFVLVRYKQLPANPALRRLLFFSLLALSCRARRAFGIYDWFFPFFDLPLLISFACCLWGDTKEVLRGMGAVFAILLALHVALVGVNHSFTRIETIQTAEGALRVKPQAAQDFRRLKKVIDEIDPTGKRPVMPLPYEALNYTLGRPNPTRLTQGFSFTLEDPADVLPVILQAKPILLISDGLLQLLSDHHRDEAKALVRNRKSPNSLYNTLLTHFTPIAGENPVGPWLVCLPSAEVSPSPKQNARNGP